MFPTQYWHHPQECHCAIPPHPPVVAPHPPIEQPRPPVVPPAYPFGDFVSISYYNAIAYSNLLARFAEFKTKAAEFEERLTEMEQKAAAIDAALKAVQNTP